MKDKWSTLTHNGPVFPAEYEYKNIPIIVNGKEYTLSKEAEELVYAWAQKHATDYIQDKVFQKNFWKCLKPLLDKELKTTKFPADWNFKEFIFHVEMVKEKRKQKTKEDRKKEKEDREERKAKYGVAILNGQETPLGNYMVEPPGLFMGRGKHPLRGTWKPRINPEDITINFSGSINPPNAPSGTNWAKVVSNKNALWTATWEEKATHAPKRILFAATSSVKQDADKKKFVKAIELAKNIDHVNEYIEKNLTSHNIYTRNIATVTHLISKLSIRVGDEKGENTADTVGAASLRFEHIKVEGRKVILDFLGKDSVRYYNEAEDLDINAVRNIKDQLKGLKKGDKVFLNITSKDVKDFLSGVMEGLTAKNFRTATGSILLASCLKDQTIDEKLKDNKKLEYFTDANLDVALQLNHQSAVSEAYDKSLKNMKERLKLLRGDLKIAQPEIKTELDKAKEVYNQRLNYAKEKYKGEKKKDSIRRAKETYTKKRERLDKKIERLKDRVENLKTKIKIKEKTRGVATATSKANYADPRVIYSWCKKQNVPIGKIYSTTFQKKFKWAECTYENFYIDYPNIQEED